MENEENGATLEPVEKPKIFGMIMNPTEQFKKMREQPVIWVPLIIVTVLTVIGMIMAVNSVDLMNQPGMEEADLTSEDIAIGNAFAMVGAVLGGLFIPIFSVLISTVIFIIVAKIAKKEVSFKQLFSMNTFIYVIVVLGMLVNGVAFLLTGNIDTEVSFTSLNSVVNADGPVGALLNSFEVFAIWTLILNAIGLQIVGKFSKGLAWGVVIAFFLIGLGFSMIGAGLTAMMGM